MNTQILTWTSSSRTDLGCVRRVNEDSCLDKPQAGLWVVADGMGGYSAGDLASSLIIETLDTMEPAQELSDFVDQVEEHLVFTNQKLRAIAQERDASAIGSTVAALLARGQHAVCMWAGDSRVYRYRAGQLEQVSQDHALVEELVEKGVLTRQQAATHPHANLVTRAVGAADELFVDVEIVDLKPGDVFVLCSDGLDKELNEAEIEAAVEAHVQTRGEESLSNVLVELALARGSRDNVTVVSVHIAGNENEQEHAEEDTTDTVPGLAVSPKES